MTAKQTSVSIVTPSLNQRISLEETLNSVLVQDYYDIEYIVIDGGSADNSLDVIKEYQNQLSYWESEPDRGQSHAINKGLRRATGDIVGWLNSDDTLYPDAVTRVVESFTATPAADLVHGATDRMDVSGTRFEKPNLPIDNKVITPDLLLAESLVNSTGAFWRRSLMKTIGYLNEELHYAMDYDYWMRMALAGAAFKRIPGRPLGSIRVWQDAKTVAGLEKSAKEAISVMDGLPDSSELAKQFGVSERLVNKRLSRGYALNSLRAFYGCLSQEGRRGDAARWLFKAARYDPRILFQRRWMELAGIKVRRRMSKVPDR